MLPRMPRIIESEACTEPGPRVKTYPKRKARTPAHWRRMDKKWLKRYGHTRVPCMYESRYDGSIFVHPMLARDLYRVLGRSL